MPPPDALMGAANYEANEAMSVYTAARIASGEISAQSVAESGVAYVPPAVEQYTPPPQLTPSQSAFPQGSVLGAGATWDWSKFAAGLTGTTPPPTYQGQQLEIQRGEMPAIGGTGLGVNWGQLAAGLAPGVLGAVGAATGTAVGAGGKGSIIGGQVVGRHRGFVQIRLPTGRAVWIKTAKHRGHRRGGGGGLTMANMLKLTMMRRMLGGGK